MSTPFEMSTGTHYIMWQLFNKLKKSKKPISGVLCEIIPHNSPEDPFKCDESPWISWEADAFEDSSIEMIN